jgi:hypothetical protein
MDNLGRIWVANQGGSNSTRSAENVVAVDTPVYIQISFTPGTGADAVAQVWHSTDGASWTSVATMSDGTATTNSNQVYFNYSGPTDGRMLIDAIRVSNSFINY